MSLNQFGHSVQVEEEEFLFFWPKMNERGMINECGPQTPRFGTSNYMLYLLVVR